ncbi:baculoviral IAP repeat-containing protein 7-B-like [Ambystoma mexicanum]|uniref:baculoviral IAP repeat-containing protein 7-B-like n=1 Tax=Ambystoma mexicanum TaxID=8296 RepID=UPI0037E9A8E4
MSYFESRRSAVAHGARRRSSSSSSLARRTVESVLNGLVPDWAPPEFRQPRMRCEEYRLQTFRHRWPSSAPVSPIDLARSGFFYIGPGDRVQCFSCGGILKSWELGENVMAEHQRFFPICPFVLGREVHNRPRDQPRGRRPDCMDGQILGQLQRMATGDSPLPEHAAHPDMVLEWTRLSSFRYWPLYAEVQPQQLARAGFFYTGQGDHVKCFYCDVGLRNWEEDDDPWTEHAKWFPRCEFLQQSLGQDYIHRIQEQYFGSSVNPGDLWQQQTEGNRSPRQELETHNQETGARPASSKDTVIEETAEEQLRRLQDERVCKVCMDNQVSIVFVPCGHLVVCRECAAGLSQCPICRAPIRGTVRTFMS